MVKNVPAMKDIRVWSLGQKDPLEKGMLQFSSVTQSCLPLCDPMGCSMPGFPVHHRFLELSQTIESVMPSNHLILCHPLILLPSIFPSTRVFSNESVLRIRWPKFWSFSFSISPSNKYSGLISFRIDWFDLLAVQGTLKSLLHHHSSKASILWCSAFSVVQLLHPYMTTGKTVALSRLFSRAPKSPQMVIAAMKIEDACFLEEKEMFAHSSILAWRISWTEEPGRLQSMRSQRAGIWLSD